MSDFPSTCHIVVYSIIQMFQDWCNISSMVCSSEFICVYMTNISNKGWDMKRPNFYRFLIGVVSGFGSLQLPARRWKFDTNTGELTNANFGFIANHQQRDLWIYESMTGWWFRTFFIFPYIGKNDPNWLIFFRGVETTNQMNTHQLIGQKWFAARFAGMVRPNVERFFLFASFASWILSTTWVLELGTPTFAWRRIKQFWGNGFEYLWSLETRTGPHSCLCAIAPFHVSNRHGMDAGVPMPMSFYHDNPKNHGFTW